MAWLPGPVPPNTWNWGGAVPKGIVDGFYFADFHGDHITIMTDPPRTLKPEEVEWYDNSLVLPPNINLGTHNWVGRLSCKLP